MHITSIGIDLGKTTFHLVALGERNKVLIWSDLSSAKTHDFAFGFRSSPLSFLDSKRSQNASQRSRARPVLVAAKRNP